MKCEHSLNELKCGHVFLYLYSPSVLPFSIKCRRFLNQVPANMRDFGFPPRTVVILAMWCTKLHDVARTTSSRVPICSPNKSLKISRIFASSAPILYRWSLTLFLKCTKHSRLRELACPSLKTMYKFASSSVPNAFMLLNLGFSGAMKLAKPLYAIRIFDESLLVLPLLATDR